MSDNIKIKINEIDTTTARPYPETADIVYIPGLSPNKDGSNINVAKKYTSLASFEADFEKSVTDDEGNNTVETTYYTYSSADEKLGLNFIEQDKIDISYLYAKNILNAGLTVYYECLVEKKDVSAQEEDEQIVSPISEFYSALPSALDRLLDKNNYTIKYITSGGYPVFGTSYDIPEDSQGKKLDPIYKEMLKIASTRGDAIALIDHAYDEELPLDPSEGDSIYKQVCDKALTDGDGAGYGAMFTPWSVYGGGHLFPASYAYLTCLARAIKTNPSFLAIAGVARGTVSGIKNLAVGKQILTSKIAENYQPKTGNSEFGKYSINAITNIQPYGLTIWGNRTLAPIEGSEPTAKNFLNTRCMLCDIKKVAYTTAKTLMFEQDSDTLWLRFKSGVSGLLEQLKLGYGIRDYKILRKAESRRGHMSATIQVYPLYAIEYFEIDVLVSDEAVAVE